MRMYYIRMFIKSRVIYKVLFISFFNSSIIRIRSIFNYIFRFYCFSFFYRDSSGIFVRYLMFFSFLFISFKIFFGIFIGIICVIIFFCFIVYGFFFLRLRWSLGLGFVYIRIIYLFYGLWIGKCYYISTFIKKMIIYFFFICRSSSWIIEFNLIIVFGFIISFFIKKFNFFDYFILG